MTVDKFHKRPRIEKGKRVKTGCLMCRSRRRKCDEIKHFDQVTQRWKCQYCFEKHLDCTWPALHFGTVFINSSVEDSQNIERKLTDNKKVNESISAPIIASPFGSFNTNTPTTRKSFSKENNDSDNHHSTDKSNSIEHHHHKDDISASSSSESLVTLNTPSSNSKRASHSFLFNPLSTTSTNNTSSHQGKSDQHNQNSNQHIQQHLPPHHDLAPTPQPLLQNNLSKFTNLQSPISDMGNLKSSLSTTSLKNYNFNLLHSMTPIDNTPNNTTTNPNPNPNTNNTNFQSTTNLVNHHHLYQTHKPNQQDQQQSISKDAMDYNNFVDIFEVTEPEYFDIPDTLRDFMFLNASNVPKQQSPLSIPSDVPPLDVFTEYFKRNDFASIEPPLLLESDKLLLMSNYLDGVSTWLDMFDKNRHFGHVIPAMAENCPPLEYAILALSAKQYEATHPDYPKNVSLILYQYALQKLAGCYNDFNTGLRAACVILCVFAMVSSSPDTWKRNLEGCFVLFKSHGVNGFSEPLERAIFWTFIRMDVCAAVIGEQVTIIDSKNWLPPGASIYDSERLFNDKVDLTNWDMYGNYMVFLCARVTNLISGSYLPDKEFEKEWRILWEEIKRWEINKPITMRPVFESDDQSSTFPSILFSNPVAISANQMYHMATILMLENKPRLLKWVSLQTEHRLSKDYGGGAIMNQQHRSMNDYESLSESSSHHSNESHLTRSSSQDTSSSDKKDNSNNNTTTNANSNNGVANNTTANSNSNSNSNSTTSSTTTTSKLNNKNNSLVQSVHSKSLTWHSRRICGIGITNPDQGARTNSLQPLWVAARLTSSVAEHNTVLKHLSNIEKEAGWPTKYRCKDLIDYWNGGV